MALLTIDQDKCKKDGICVAECPFNLILEREEDGLPEIRPAAERLCIHCGHCVAVCPHEALQLGTVTATDCQPLTREHTAPTEALEQFFKSRRSIRNYQTRPVPRELLERIIDTSRWAPSAKNGQPVHWLVVENPDEVRRLAGLVVEWFRQCNNFPGLISAWKQGRDMVLHGAPHLALAHAGRNGLKPEVDCTIALTHLELAAHAHGVGACWAGFLMSAARHYPPLVKALDLPPGHQVYGALMLGYPKFRYRRIPPRRPARIEWR